MKNETSPTAIYSDGEYLRRTKTWHSEDSPYKAALVSKLIDRNAIPFAQCADVGCGAGLVTEILADRYPQRRFVGFELANDAQRFWGGRRRLSNLSYSNANILSSQEKVDLIICLDVFEHIEDYLGFLKTLRSKGRRFIFNIPLDMNVMKMMTPGIKYAREEGGHLHYFNEYTATKTLEDCGYEIQDSRISIAYLATMPRNVRQLIALPFRVLSLAFGTSLAAKMFGGVSLAVYATAV